MNKNRKDFRIPGIIWRSLFSSELQIPMEIIENEVYTTAIYKPTKVKGIRGYEFRLIGIKGQFSREEKFLKRNKNGIIKLCEKTVEK